MNDKLQSLFEEAFSSLGIENDGQIFKKLAIYTEEVCRWNRKINLTGGRTPDLFVRGPLFDALCLLPAYRSRGTLVDVGTGAGLPGIPLVLVLGDVEVTLVEPRAKRAAFLRHVCHRLELSLEILEHREEDLDRHNWQGAVAQAVWAPEEWIPRGAGLVEPGGVVYVLSTAPVSKEAIPRGCEVGTEIEILRPFDGAKRYTTAIVCG